MPKIFISYRRADAADAAGRVFDRLAAEFGKQSVFKDVDSIDPGDDFADVIAHRVRDCDAVIVVIGRFWLTVSTANSEPRLHNPGDFVRMEIERALNEGVLVIPALVAKADMPTANQLPDSIRPLASRHAVSIRPDPDFHSDMDRLIRSLRKYFEGNPQTTPAAVPVSSFGIPQDADDDNNSERIVVKEKTKKSKKNNLLTYTMLAAFVLSGGLALWYFALDPFFFGRGNVLGPIHGEVEGNVDVEPKDHFKSEKFNFSVRFPNVKEPPREEEMVFRYIEMQVARYVPIEKERAKGKVVAHEMVTEMVVMKLRPHIVTALLPDGTELKVQVYKFRNGALKAVDTVLFETLGKVENKEDIKIGDHAGVGGVVELADNRQVTFRAVKLNSSWVYLVTVAGPKQSAYAREASQFLESFKCHASPQAIPKPLPPEIVNVWSKHSAEVGWMDEYGRFFVAEEGGDLGDVPAFQLSAWNEIAQEILPGPETAFGLRITGVDPDLKGLSRLQAMQRLDLCQIDVTDAGLKELARLKNLQTLILHSVTDVGLKHLTELKNLQRLELWSDVTNLTDAGLKEMRTALPACQIIKPPNPDNGNDLVDKTTEILNETRWQIPRGPEGFDLIKFSGFPVGRVVFSPQGNLLASSDSSFLEVRNAPSGRLVRRFAIEKDCNIAFVNRIAFSHDGAVVAAGVRCGNSMRLFAWNVQKAALIGEIDLGPAYKGNDYLAIESMVFDPEGKHVYFGFSQYRPTGDSRTVVRIIPNEQHIIHRWTLTEKVEDVFQTPEERNAFLLDLFSEVSPKGTAVRAVLQCPDKLAAWSSRSSNELRSLDVKGGFNRLKLNWDGKVAAGLDSRDGTVRILDMDTGAQFCEFQETMDADYPLNLQQLTFSPDGRWLATWNRDSDFRTEDFPRLKIWDTRTGKLLFHTHSNTPKRPVAVEDVSFSPDGKVMAAYLRDRGGTVVVRLWDVPSLQLGELPLPQLPTSPRAK